MELSHGVSQAEDLLKLSVKGAQVEFDFLRFVKVLFTNRKNFETRRTYIYKNAHTLHIIQAVGIYVDQIDLVLV